MLRFLGGTWLTSVSLPLGHCPLLRGRTCDISLLYWVPPHAYHCLCGQFLLVSGTWIAVPAFGVFVGYSSNVRAHVGGAGHSLHPSISQLRGERRPYQYKARKPIGVVTGQGRHPWGAHQSTGVGGTGERFIHGLFALGPRTPLPLPSPMPLNFPTAFYLARRK